jgi:hypothetical protein
MTLLASRHNALLPYYFETAASADLLDQFISFFTELYENRETALQSVLIALTASHEFTEEKAKAIVKVWQNASKTFGVDSFRHILDFHNGRITLEELLPSLSQLYNAKDSEAAAPAAGATSS